MSLPKNWITKTLVRGALLLSVLFGISYLPQIALADQPQNDSAKAAEILAEVNKWRAENGLWPLTVNPTLEALAISQAAYIAPIYTNFSDESQYHLDASLRNPRDRAAVAGWPKYGNNPLHIEVGENAAIGTVKYAMTFWRGSEIHSRAALSGTYREVGVAAIPQKGGSYIFMIDFGARPEVLPIVPTTDGKSIWLTDEKSRYAKGKSVSKVRLFDLSDKPLTDQLNWTPILSLPNGITADQVKVVYTTAAGQITTTINRGPFTTGPAAAFTPAPTTASGSGAVAVNPTVVPTQRAPDVVPTATIPAQPPIDPATADIVLTYDANGLYLRNNSKSAVDISGLSMIGSGVTVGTPLWAKLADFPAAAFPASHCLAAQLATADTPIPPLCKWTRSIINLQPAKIFWAKDNFIVSLNGTALATCKPSDGICAIDLP